MKTYKLKNKDIEITEDELEELIKQRDEKVEWKRWRGIEGESL